MAKFDFDAFPDANEADSASSDSNAFDFDQFPSVGSDSSDFADAGANDSDVETEKFTFPRLAKARMAIGGAIGKGLDAIQIFPDTGALEGIDRLTAGVFEQGGMTPELAAREATKTRNLAIDGANIVGNIGAAAGQSVGELVSGGIPAAARKANRATNTGLKKIGKFAGNIPEEITEEYLERQDNITARSLDDIVADIDSQVAGKRTALDQAQDKIAVDRTKLGDAKALADRARLEATEELKSRNLRQLSGDIGADLDQLKIQISQGSKQSFDVLENAASEAASLGRSSNVSLKPMLDKLDEGINGSFVQGANGPTLVTAEAEATVRALQELKDRLAPFGGRIPLKNAKTVLQAYDRVTQYGQPGFDAAVNATKKQARRALSEAIGDQVPAYREVMRGVSAKTSLYSDLLESGFASEEKIAGTLGRLSSPAGRQFTLPKIEQLAAESGASYKAQLDKYFEAQDILQSPTAKQDFLTSLPESRAADQAQRSLGASQSAADAAKASFDDVAPFQRGAAQKVGAIRGARDFDLEKDFRRLDSATGKNFTAEAKDRTLLDAFGKQDKAGSRKTVMGGAAGTSLGFLMGGAEGSFYGASLGAQAGFIADAYSGPVFKALLNKKISADKGAQMLAEKFGKYSRPLASAASRGTQALTTTQFLLQRTDPEYRQILEEQRAEQ